MTTGRSLVTRRRFVQATAAGSIMAAGLGLGRTGRAQTGRPNIVFIMADDLGYADVSCYGQRDYTTPNVDRLALEGLRFTQAYSNSPVCSPTRVALITGRYQYRLAAGLEEPINLQSAKNAGLPPSHPTLPSILKKAGYATELIGKWHLGFLPDFSPLKSGYDRFFGFFGGTADYFDHGSKSRTPLYEQEVTIDRNGYMTNLLGDRAVQSIADYAKAKQPFLISLHFNAPHYPWIGPDDQEEAKRVKDFIHYEGGSQKTYAAMVQSMDLNIGKVLQMLDAQGIAGNTIVVFTSDNGGERFSKIWPFSGMKQELLEGGVRIPAIVRWPGQVAAGQVSERVTATMDWLPTLLAAAGAAPDPAYPPDGDNLVPVMTGKARPHPRKLFFRFRPGQQRAVRDGDMKYLRIAGNEFLFDVVKDPRERANLKVRQADVFNRLKTEWEEWDRTMLPQKPGIQPYRHPGHALADHYGVTNPK
ncbi:MAG: sulfatase-like hydrolase/transferase [Xanthobacteraceae bacterium]|nr:sulfatase-like hydrolase/transferase [Xanthobacteraceae bacterium]